MPDQPRPYSEIADDAAQAAQDFQSATTPAARSAAKAKLDKALRDAEILNRSDTETGSKAIDVVKSFRQQAGVPDAPAQADAAPDSRGGQQPQTKSGAGGSPAAAATDHGFIRPQVDGGLIGSLSAELLAIQKKLCAHLTAEPDGLDDRRGGKSTVADIAWEAAYSELIAEMAAKENQLAYNAALTDGGFDESDADELRGVRDQLRAAADKLAESDDTRAEADKMRKQVDDYEKTYKAVAENLVPESAADEAKKGAAKAKKGVDQAIKGGQTADRWAKNSNDITKTATDAKRAAGLKKLDKALPTPTKAMGHVGKLNPMGQAAGMIGAGFLRMGHFASQLRQLELDKKGSKEAGEALTHQRQAEAALGRILDRKIAKGVEVLNKRLARENPGETPPLFTLHRHGNSGWDKTIAERIGNYFESELDTTDGRYKPSAALGQSQISRGVPFDREQFKKWCGSKKLLAMGTPNRTPLYLIAAVAVALGVGGFVLVNSGDDEPVVEEAKIVVGNDPIIEDVPADDPVEEIIVDEPVVDEPIVDEPVIEEVVPGPPMFITPTGGCGNVTHSPLDGSDAPSFFFYDALFATEQGLAPDGTVIDILVDGFDSVPVETMGGVGGAPFPVYQYGDYAMSITGASGPDGPLEIVNGNNFDVVTVGPDEGPIGGCVDPASLSDADRQAAANRQGQVFPVLGAVVDEPGAIPPPTDDLAPYREFLTRFDAAHRSGEAATLFETLHPSVIQRYGAEQCQSYLEATVGSVGELFLVDGFAEPWNYPTDELTTDVPNSWTINMEATVTSSGERQTFDFHLADSNDGVQWFTDCGEPLTP